LEKEYLFKNSLCFVFPSLYEGFGLPVLEAYAHGTPTVLSDIPVFNELFKHSSVIVDKDDPEKIAHGIESVIKSEKKRKELVKKGRERLRYFSWEKTAKETLKILND